MKTVDRIKVHALIEGVFDVASDVERWPEFLPHYRWVRMLERHAHGGLVEMAAWRPFGVFKYPTWWVSEIQIAREDRVVRYHHVRGVTQGMDVEWRLTAREGTTEIIIVHEWDGPNWMLLGKPAANLVIGPVFIHGIASRTLAGVKRKAEE